MCMDPIAKLASQQMHEDIVALTEAVNTLNETLKGQKDAIDKELPVTVMNAEEIAQAIVLVLSQVPLMVTEADEPVKVEVTNP